MNFFLATTNQFILHIQSFYTVPFSNKERPQPVIYLPWKSFESEGSIFTNFSQQNSQRNAGQEELWLTLKVALHQKRCKKLSCQPTTSEIKELEGVKKVCD
jgi:hypothetical protein